MVHTLGAPLEKADGTTEQMHDASREMDILRKNQEEPLQVSLNIVPELKSVCHGLIREWIPPRKDLCS